MKIASTGRQVFKRGATGAVAALLQTVFVSEMIYPSRCLWLVSPWVSDIEVVDNRTGGFLHLEPRWPLGPVHLSDVLAVLVARGTAVHVATRPARPRATDSGRHNDRFLSELRMRVAQDATLYVHRNEEEHLHTKGLLGDRFFLSGSMNFTYNGIVVNDEYVRFTTDSTEVAEARIAFRERWGGPV